MNWVGGSRTRVLIKQERRKQKEYFEKKRLKSKMKLRGVLSPVKNSAVSLDLLNLYMVNQISCQKKRPETVRKQIHVNMNRDIKMPLRKHDLELPMSPHLVPSNLCIDDMENNLHYQRQGSKEELGPVKSSQVMDSYTMFEPQLSRIENCSFTPPSLSAELASNRDITRQNFIPRIVPSPQKVAYEKKQNEQLSNVNYSNSVISKLNKNQDAFSPSYKTAQFGTLFERLNSPGNRNFLTERPDIVTGEDCGTMDERRQSDFIIEKQSVQHILEENRKEVSNFLEDANQPTPSLLSENCDSFISENVINLLNIDQWSIKKTFDKCDFDSMGDICAVTSSDKNHSTERCIRSMFTNPELTFSNSTFNKTSYPEKCQPNKNYQKEYNDHERNNLSTSFEKDSFPASSEKKGKFESDYQEKAPQKTIQIYPVNRLGNIPLKELPSKQSWNFGLGESLMEKGGTCSLKGRPTSTTKVYLESSQSSWSTSCSPRPTDSCFSSSSEMLSEDEDQILQQIEDSNRRSIKTKETTNSFYLERMAKLPHDRIAKNNAKIHKQNENFHQFSLKDKTDQFPQSQCDSAHIVQDKSSNCTVQVARCDAWVQTESEPVMKEKLDAAIQCDIISKCKCISDVSSLCDVERCSENIKADTTGGQEILKNN
ncbi:regulator of DNA class I crossover intermediates 1-like isoform X1 [Equus asinus]|uniref:regulator of DNA class I crossover intermediates 1 isoform X1 n=3 Tax=Equus asinus TaxID=9793 RepID=UPI0038F7E52E